MSDLPTLIERPETFSEAELTCLRWCVKCNRDRIGFLGPSVRRQGPLPEYQRLVDEGYVALIAGHSVGYWITKTGRAALTRAGEFTACAAISCPKEGPAESI